MKAAALELSLERLNVDQKLTLNTRLGRFPRSTALLVLFLYYWKLITLISFFCSKTVSKYDIAWNSPWAYQPFRYI